MKKITIVGGSGFIGHNLAIKLHSLGYIVSIIDNLEINNLGALEKEKNYVPFPDLSKKILKERIELLSFKNILIHRVDASNHGQMKIILDKLKPHTIIHLAAVSHANKSNKNPKRTFDNSLVSLFNSLDYAKNTVEHFIFASSSMVYGNFKSETVDETTNCEPIGVYGALKYAAEKMIISFNQVFNLPYTIIRPSALYGERCISRRVGQIFIESALNKQKIIINGNGKEKLDFTYIEDLIQGFVKIIETPKSKNEIFNITYGAAKEINEMLEILKSYFSDIEVINKDREKFTPTRGTLSTDKAKDLLNYQPSWSLENGYPKYINWYKDIFDK